MVALGAKCDPRDLIDLLVSGPLRLQVDVRGPRLPGSLQ